MVPRALSSTNRSDAVVLRSQLSQWQLTGGGAPQLIYPLPAVPLEAIQFPLYLRERGINLAIYFQCTAVDDTLIL